MSKDYKSKANQQNNTRNWT